MEIISIQVAIKNVKKKVERKSCIDFIGVDERRSAFV